MSRKSAISATCGLFIGLAGLSSLAIAVPYSCSPRLSIGLQYLKAGGSIKSVEFTGTEGRIQVTVVGGGFGGSTPLRYRSIDPQGNPTIPQIDLTNVSASLFGGSASFALGEFNLGYLVELPAEDPNEANVYVGTTVADAVPITATPADQRALGGVAFTGTDPLETDPFQLAYIFEEDSRILAQLATATEDGAFDLGTGISARIDQSGLLGDGFSVRGSMLPFDFRKGGDGSAMALAVWSSVGATGADASGASIQGRMIDANAQPVGDQFLINDVTAGSQFQPRIAGNSNGNMVVVWTSESSPGTDNDALSIQARLLNSSGSFAGPQFQVNQTTAGFQFLPDVAMDDVGDFIVVWQDQNPLTGSLIYGRSFNADGSPASDDIILSEEERANVTFPRVLLGPSNVAVGYAEGGSIIIRGCYPAFFRNGFESGIVN